MRSGGLLLAVAVGCTSSGPSSILGTETVVYLTPTGSMTRPQDLSALKFRAFVDGGNGFTAYPANDDVTGTVDGTFDIPDVPDEPFLPRITAGGLVSWEQHDARPVTSNAVVIGVPDAVTSSHVLAVDVPDGMHGFFVELIALSGGEDFLIWSPTTQVTLPANLFEPGKYYAFRVSVFDDNGNGSISVLGKVLLGPASSSKCGDGVVDPDRGETCDDGNTVDGDGCSSTCQ
jgi:cysteine-rich repeat protein